MPIFQLTSSSNFFKTIAISRKPLAGWITLASLSIYVIYLFYGTFLLGVSSALYCIALLLLIPDLKRQALKQLILIMTLSLPGFILSTTSVIAELQLSKWNINTGILSMIMAVGFFNLLDRNSKTIPLTKCPPKNYLFSWLQVHFIGAVLNYAALIIYGDRFKKNETVTLTEAALLSRAFAAGGFWSPFFVTMAVAMTYSPNSHYSGVLFGGIILAFASLLFSAMSFSASSEEMRKFDGLSMGGTSFKLPIVLSLFIFTALMLFPAMGILPIVTVTGMSYMTYTYFTQPVVVKKYIQEKLPYHVNEIALFIGVGILTHSLSGMAHHFNLTFPIHTLSYLHCISFMIIALSLTLIGIHPLLSISIFSSACNTTSINADMFAFTLFSTWAIGSALGPLSGQNLLIGSRYNINTYQIMKKNSLHSCVLSLIAFLILRFWF